MLIEIQTSNNENILLSPIRKNSDEGSNNIFELIDEQNKKWLEIKLENNSFYILNKDEEITEDEDLLKIKLDKLVLEVIEAEQSGTENNETAPNEEIQPFNPEDIKVHSKQFSLRLISDMIDDKDIDLAPDFQRHFVWNNFQKSRLIESILLRIPLPMFYFSEDEEGRITIVDGLQRLTTIKEFMENKFPLKNLEYLTETCEGRYYSDAGRKVGLDSKYSRWFNQTQFSVNVIDPSSPPKVKYDIFRRINTGGKPLNNQEIRNCLASTSLRDTLNAMVNLLEFKTATDYSIKETRMDDQEIALRFIMFHRYIEKDGFINEYNGYMDTALDDLTDELSKLKAENLERYIALFSNAMKNAEYLFGKKYAFRKIRPNDLQPYASKQLINKALFVSWSVMLANYDHEMIKANNPETALLIPLSETIQEDWELLSYLSYGTNGKNNLLYVFGAVENLIQNILTV
ncbi:uncharacterized protein DUF262 [Flavobacterium sp. 1]|uniref:DUF262 domain-containing protein n=1 Tax=Flavobacterium sp. 1 TaxID=2035200 RepID=UPI000C24F631|nr:DUF262 domain-containing protein [Flavobacterium sp. 1]PJJ06891.1 uncharacterized protein DUF262 [Flavobacterium sp. 1]